MRSKKFWKVLGSAVALFVALLLLFVVAFIFNPFEGSLPDMREVVPRDVDFFVRKLDLRDDFATFPEPKFWKEFADSSSWQQIRNGPAYRDLARDVDVDQLVAGLQRADKTIRDSSGGFVGLLPDIIGNELIVAGKFGTPSLQATHFCAYTRVSWKLRFAWGLLQWDSVRSGIAEPKITLRADGTLEVRPTGGQPMFVGRYLDCLMVANDDDLLKRSLDLARGQSGADSFGGSSYYRDGVEARLQQWSQNVGVEPNALELYVRPDQLFPITTWDDSWPNPQSPDDMNQRVLASFLNLRGWRFLTGSLIFEGDPTSVTMLGRIELNRNMHTGFQAEFFKAEPQDRHEWLDPFLSMVPETACAAAALRMPAGDFLHEMFQAVDPDLRREIDQALVRTGQYDGVNDLIEKIRPALKPRTGFVFHKTRPIGGGIETFEPSPAPHVAWVFWIDDRFRKPLQDLYQFMTQYSAALQFKSAYDLDVTGGQSGDAAREFTNPNIPATGEVAILLYRDFFVVSNSGPLIRDMIRARLSGRNVTQLPDYRQFQLELAPKLNGFVFVQGPRLVEVVEDYQQFLETSSSEPDQGWMLSVRPTVEREVLRRDYPSYTSVAALPRTLRDEFDRKVVQDMQQRWTREKSQVVAGDREKLAQLRALASTFSSSFLQVTLDPQWMQWKSRTLFSF